MCRLSKGGGALTKPSFRRVTNDLLEAKRLRVLWFASLSLETERCSGAFMTIMGCTLVNLSSVQDHRLLRVTDLQRGAGGAGRLSAATTLKQ